MTSHRLLTEDERRRGKALLAAYGAARERWPKDDARLYDRLQADGPTHFDDEVALDAILANARTADAGGALKGRILSDFERVSNRPMLFGLRLGRLLPAGGFAALSALGFAIGAASANDQAYAPLDLAGAALADAYQEEADWSVY